MKYRKIFDLLALLAFLPFIMNADCGDSNSKKQYTVHYMTYQSSDLTVSVPADVKVDAGTEILTVLPETTGKSQDSIYEYTKIRTALVEKTNQNNYLVELGYKKLKVESDMTIVIKFGSAATFYVLDFGNNNDSSYSATDYSILFLEMTVSDQIITGPDGINYKITRWKDSSGKTYKAGDVITHDGTYDNYFLYSVDPTPLDGKSITYNGNSSTSGTVPETGMYGSGKQVTLPDNTGKLKKPGYKFLGWCESQDGSGTNYAAGSTYTITKNTTLYAVWGRNIMVNFDGNNYPDPSNPPAPIITGDNMVILPRNDTNLNRDGYDFSGWNTRANGTGDTYMPGQTMILTCNTTLFAKWTGETVAGNGIAIKVANNTDIAIDDAHRFYYSITTDKYLQNPASVVSYGWLASVADTESVDLPTGTYYVWGFIDKDGSGDLSAGDYMYAATDYPSGFAFQFFPNGAIKAFAIPANGSSYQEATVAFSKGTLLSMDCYNYPGSDSIVQVTFNYTGTNRGTDDMLRILCSSNPDFSQTKYYHSYGSSMVDKSSISFIARIPLNTPYYFAARIYDWTGTGYAATSYGGKYHRMKWSENATPFIANKNIVYGIIESFGD